MSLFGRPEAPIPITGGDTPSIDAFGRLRTGEPFTLFDSKQTFDNQPLAWDDQQVSGASTTSTHSTDTASTTMGVANTTAGRRVRQTFNRFNYQPGKSQLVLLTGILGAGESGITQTIGYGDDDNGIFFRCVDGTVQVVRRTSTSGTAADITVDQTSWNLDSMNGSGTSGITVDWDKTLIFYIDFEWLGVGRVRVGLVINGLIYYVHEFLNSNVNTVVYMSTPNLPLRYELENDGTGGAYTIEHICSSVLSEGGFEDLGILRYNSTSNTEIDANVAGSIYVICGLRLKSTALGVNIRIRSMTILNDTADNFEWLLILNPTVAAGGITFSAQTNSAIEFGVGEASNPSTSTVTGGILVTGGMVKSSAQAGSFSSDIRNSRPIGSAIDGTRDEIYLCARPFSANANISGGVTWQEIG